MLPQSRVICLGSTDFPPTYIRTEPGLDLAVQVSSRLRPTIRICGSLHLKNSTRSDFRRDQYWAWMRMAIPSTDLGSVDARMREEW